MERDKNLENLLIKRSGQIGSKTYFCWPYLLEEHQNQTCVRRVGETHICWIIPLSQFPSQIVHGNLCCSSNIFRPSSHCLNSRRKLFTVTFVVHWKICLVFPCALSPDYQVKRKERIFKLFVPGSGLGTPKFFVRYNVFLPYDIKKLFLKVCTPKP